MPLTILTKQSCHPRYLGVKAHAKLSKPGAFDGLRIHTDEINEVIARLAQETLTIAVVSKSVALILPMLIAQVMDSMDWFDPASTAANEQVIALYKVLKFGGRVLLRSAAIRPWYIDAFEANGFACSCVGKRVPGTCIDRYVQSRLVWTLPANCVSVNMYASTWVCTKSQTPPSSPASRRRYRSSTLEQLEIGQPSLPY